MNVKIDTKEKFTVITLNETNISANMTGELTDLLLSYPEKSIPHIILNLANVENIDSGTGEKIASLQQMYYEKNCSFIVCGLQKKVLAVLEKNEWFDMMNITLTESEAWDILQMEEVERELMRDLNAEENE